eukprot:scaffold37891_cov20-Cyclotella_meneghiniana.AAC.1
MNPRHSAKSSLKWTTLAVQWPTLAVQFNDFLADIDQPTAYAIHHKTYRLQRRIVIRQKV